MNRRSVLMGLLGLTVAPRAPVKLMGAGSTGVQYLRRVDYVSAYPKSIVMLYANSLYGKRAEKL